MSHKAKPVKSALFFMDFLGMMLSSHNHISLLSFIVPLKFFANIFLKSSFFFQPPWTQKQINPSFVLTAALRGMVLSIYELLGLGSWVGWKGFIIVTLPSCNVTLPSLFCSLFLNPKLHVFASIFLRCGEKKIERKLVHRPGSSFLGTTAEFDFSLYL